MVDCLPSEPLAVIPPDQEYLQQLKDDPRAAANVLQDEIDAKGPGSQRRLAQTLAAISKFAAENVIDAAHVLYDHNFLQVVSPFMCVRASYVVKPADGERRLSGHDTFRIVSLT